MKNAGSAPATVHSSQTTRTTIASAKIDWRWRRMESDSSLIGLHATRRLWPPDRIDGTIVRR